MIRKRPLSRCQCFSAGLEETLGAVENAAGNEIFPWHIRKDADFEAIFAVDR